MGLLTRRADAQLGAPVVLVCRQQRFSRSCVAHQPQIKYLWTEICKVGEMRLATQTRQPAACAHGGQARASARGARDGQALTALPVKGRACPDGAPGCGRRCRRASACASWRLGQARAAPRRWSWTRWRAAAAALILSTQTCRRSSSRTAGARSGRGTRLRASTRWTSSAPWRPR